MNRRVARLLIGMCFAVVLAFIGLALIALANNFRLATPALAGGGFVAYGATVAGSVSEENPADRWQFQAAANDVVTIIMERTDGPLDPYLQLLGPGGNEITWDDDSGGELNARITGFRLLETGTFTIVATRYGTDAVASGELNVF